MTERERLLRAAVYVALDARDTPDYREALDRMVFVQRTWPLIRYHDAILAAERDIEERVSQVEAKPWLVHELLPGFYE